MVNQQINFFLQFSFSLDHKLATFLPSIQCGLALLCAAKRYSKTFYRDIAGLSSEPMLSVPAVLGVDMVSFGCYSFYNFKTGK